MTTLQEAAQYRSLYEVTGDIKDINTLLVPRTALAQQGEQRPVCHGCGIPAGDVHMSTCKSGKWPSRVSNGDTAAPAPQAQDGTFIDEGTKSAPQPAQGERVISVDQLSTMFRNTNTDKNQWGHYHAIGWNDALRQAMDYAALQSAQPVARPLTLEQLLDIVKKLGEPT